jgi:hypothetical protein
MEGASFMAVRRNLSKRSGNVNCMEGGVSHGSVLKGSQEMKHTPCLDETPYLYLPYLNLSVVILQYEFLPTYQT